MPLCGCKFRLICSRSHFICREKRNRARWARRWRLRWPRASITTLTRQRARWLRLKQRLSRTLQMPAFMMSCSADMWTFIRG